MKEFAHEHPWLTFFLIDGIVTGIVNIVMAVTGSVKVNAGESAKEEGNNESSGDIQ